MVWEDVVDIRNDVAKIITKNKITKKYKKRKLSKIKNIILHCTDGFSNVWGTLNYDLSTKNHITPGTPLPGLTYHFFVGTNDAVQWAMPLEDITWHAGNWNGNSIGVVLQYRATGNDKSPPFDQLKRAQDLIIDLCLVFKINPSKNIFGHVETLQKKSKTCPGNLVKMKEVRQYIICGVQRKLKDAGLYLDEIDGKFGPKSLKALEQWENKLDLSSK